MRITFIASCIALLAMPACSQEVKLSGTAARVSDQLAFPGVEGYGKFTSGGREGVVKIVTNLNDDGPGSLREAAGAKVPRIIVFEVSGTIHLRSPLTIRGDVTIAGQSAPGDGICIADHPVVVNGNNVIIRYLRFRLGDRFQNKGKVDGSGHDDALSAVRRKHLVIDHCTLSWSNDECFSVYAGDSTTLQWNLISEPLDYSYHFEKGDSDYEHHGYGAIWGGRHLTVHHNLFAHCSNRNPRFDGIRNVIEENIDYRNNVIYNWGGNNIYGGEGGNYNLVNNYYKYGPSTHTNVRFRIVNPHKRDPDISFGKFFVQGNYVDGHEEMTADNSLGVVMGSKGTSEDKTNALLSQPVALMQVPTESAKDAYESVLKYAGASYRRDTLDARVVENVRNRTGRIIDVQGGHPHGTAYEKTEKAWPALKGKAPKTDTDRDGMPDDWEKSRQLDASNPADAASYTLSKGYTNLEVYLNGLLQEK